VRQLLPDLVLAPDLYDVYGRDWLEPGGLRVNFVASLDGAVSVNGLSAPLQTPGDNAVFAVLRDLADVVLVGRGTVTGEGYGPLTPNPRRAGVRRDRGLGADLPLAIVSARLDLDPDGAVFDTPAGAPRTIVVTRAQAPADRLARLRARADVIVAGDDTVDVAAARAQLEARGLRRILSEGGPNLLTSLLATSAADELCLTVAPLLAGPGAGRIVAGPPLMQPRRGRIISLLAEDDALFYRFAIDRVPSTEQPAR
jgi:riboflavin biosynthesis pyrimidine reductase